VKNAARRKEKGRAFSTAVVRGNFAEKEINAMTEKAMQFVRVYGLPPQLRSDTARQASRVRRVSFDAGAFMATLDGIPSDEISPMEFARVRRSIAAVLTEAQTTLNCLAVLMETLATMDVPEIDSI
jgi:hypothetical protein